MAVSAWEASSAKLVVLLEEEEEAEEELAVETVAKEAPKEVRALLVAVSEVFLVAVAIIFLVGPLSEVEDGRPLALVPLSVDLLLVVVEKKNFMVCFHSNTG